MCVHLFTFPVTFKATGIFHNSQYRSHTPVLDLAFMLVIPPFKECMVVIIFFLHRSHHYYLSMLVCRTLNAERFETIYFPSGNVWQLKCTYFFLYCKESYDCEIN